MLATTAGVACPRTSAWQIPPSSRYLEFVLRSRYVLVRGLGGWVTIHVYGMVGATVTSVSELPQIRLLVCFSHAQKI